MIPTVLQTPLGSMLRPMLERLSGGTGSSQASQPTLPRSVSTLPPKTVQHPLSAPHTTAVGLLSDKSQFTEEEEEELLLVRAMLLSNELLSTGTPEGFKVTMGALNLIRTTLSQVLEDPTDPRRRLVSTNSEEYKEMILPLRPFGITEMLRLCGFRLTHCPTLKEEVWHLSDNDGSESVLSITLTHVCELIELISQESQTSKCTPCGGVSTHYTTQSMKNVTPPLTPRDALKGEEAMRVIMHDSVKPIRSFNELMQWSASSPGRITPAVPCRRRASSSESDRPRLLVCHDMMGGYLPGDYGRFAVCSNSSDSSSLVASVVDRSYTINYWNIVDYFVYFAHHLISPPPKEWINAAHREGVPALGTIITEGNGMSIRAILHEGKSAAAAIKQLVDMCNAYNFDGYLVNIETGLDETLAKRLVTFVAMLKRSLNKLRPKGSMERIVIWYDAVTIDGRVVYQNGLTQKNKPYFDVCDGLFINYAWRPYELPISTALAGPRRRDVYVGVDVFGRGVYGGGGYNSFEAIMCANKEKLSAAVFAPGWTMENESAGRREKFLQADARMWSKIQPAYISKYIEIDTLPVWTCFLSEVGKCFHVDGVPVQNYPCVHRGCDAKETNIDQHTLLPEWCQLSQAHLKPCYQLMAGSSTGDPWCSLPCVFMNEDSERTREHGHAVPVEWTNRCVWMGDRSLSFTVPPNCTVTFMRWNVSLEKGTICCKGETSVLAFLDIAWVRHSASAEDRPPRCVCVEGLSGSSKTQLVFDERVASTERRVVATVGEWEIVRYTIVGRVMWSCITSVSVLNPSETHPLTSTIGGVAIIPPSHDDAHSVLLMGEAHTLPSTLFVVERTNDPTTFVLIVKMPSELQKPSEKIMLFARVGCKGGQIVNTYMGIHTVKQSIQVPLQMTSNEYVYELFFYGVSSGS
uniref:mannosyl-glycoprotein endo-beta-N-acetylglucosaminidase n=1 Tax=Trypanosoma congolense (strain IL3000) TaxID=1068625 RepID=G0UTJ0_TRYCI|nr:putative endo-beta-N-acetylglucosaminidase [Trypanosoma congolense IL3000]